MNADSNKQTHDIIVGIDLGTTNSLVAVCDAAGPRILPGPGGQPILPSVVRLDAATGKPTAIGAAARASAVEHPETTIYSAKRLMGRGLSDVAGDVAGLAYPVVAGEQDTARVKIGEHIISPQEISAMLLAELKRWAEAALGHAVKKAVVTVPAYFDDAQRQATRDAGRLAGLEVVRIINEPTAAALAYGLGRSKGPRGQGAQGPSASKKTGGTISLNTKLNPAACASESDDSAPGPLDPSAPSAETIAVYDLGGGTFDISILKLQQTDDGSIDQVLATAGDTHLGGDDVDNMIIERVMAEVREQLGTELNFPPSTRQALRNFAEQTKIKLSADDAASIQIDLGEGQLYERTIRRDEFEAMIQPWIARTLEACKSAVRSAGLTIEQIDRVVMVGGSTRIPAVCAAVAEFFQTEPYTALDPDQVVALGAATQGARLSGALDSESGGRGLLLDVIPLSLGIETMGGAVAKLITANSTIPARATEMFSTYAEGQTKVAINVYQGERELTKDCRLLGAFELTGIPPMPAGLPKVEVTFLVDANGVLTVSATEQRSGRRARIQVVPNHGLTRDEVDRIERDSFAHAKADMTAHRLIDLKLNAKLDLRNIQRQIDRVGDQLDPAYRREICAHMQTVQRHIDTPDDQADADMFHVELTAMDHATIKLAEIAIAQTLRQEQGSA